MEHDTAPLPLPPLGVRADVLPLNHQSWLVRIAGGLLTYLPVLLMALLAAVTWWLVREASEPEPTLGPRVVRHEPDYEMRGFSVQRYGASGPSASVVDGERMRHYPDTDTLEIDAVRIRWRDADGRLTLATARRAVSLADGSELVLEGDAKVVREAARGARASGDERFEFRTDWMQIDVRQQKVRTDRPVVVLLGRSRFEARSLTYDHHEHVIELNGPVHGHVEAPSAGQP